jgi:hypothetical protein
LEQIERHRKEGRLFFVSFFVPEKEESVENKKRDETSIFPVRDWECGKFPYEKEEG